MKKIGITGNIASGKTECEKIIENLGFKVFDLDKISHTLLENNIEIKKKVFDTFHTLKRKELARIVFSDNSLKQALESIVHPILKQETIKILNNQTNAEAVFVSGALLYEAKFDSLFDKIIFVDAFETIRLERLKKRNNLSEKDAQLRLKSQNANFKTKADYIIENNSNFKNLELQIKSVINTIING